ncbi:MAG: ATP synthase subunit I [Oscillospiraceae bacterium]|nr:ATP synthase subunit I [Oscillospiraceae bacterium]
MKRKPKNPALAELKDMLPMFLIVNGLVLIGLAVYGAFEGITWRAFTGLLLGNILCISNFLLLGAAVNKTVTKITEKQGKFYATVNYGGRYIGLFLCLAAGLYFKVIDIIPAFAPLFVPKLHYTVKYVFTGKKYGDLNN